MATIIGAVLLTAACEDPKPDRYSISLSNTLPPGATVLVDEKPATMDGKKVSLELPSERPLADVSLKARYPTVCGEATVDLDIHTPPNSSDVEHARERGRVLDVTASFSPPKLIGVYVDGKAAVKVGNLDVAKSIVDVHTANCTEPVSVTVDGKAIGTFTPGPKVSSVIVSTAPDTCYALKLNGYAQGGGLDLQKPKHLPPGRVVTVDRTIHDFLVAPVEKVQALAGERITRAQVLHRDCAADDS